MRQLIHAPFELEAEAKSVKACRDAGFILFELSSRLEESLNVR